MNTDLEIIRSLASLQDVFFAGSEKFLRNTAYRLRDHSQDCARLYPNEKEKEKASQTVFLDPVSSDRDNGAPESGTNGRQRDAIVVKRQKKAAICRDDDANRISPVLSSSSSVVIVPGVLPHSSGRRCKVPNYPRHSRNARGSGNSSLSVGLAVHKGLSATDSG